MTINRRDFIKATSAFILQFGLAGRASAQSPGSPADEARDTMLSASPFYVLMDGFGSPAAETRPGGYWWWFNGLMDKAGITRDMEEFRNKGLGEVLLVNSAAGLGTIPTPNGPDFLSDGWFELFTFALAEAKRCGIRMGFNLCSGWCMGGPWITPPESGRWFLQSRKRVTGPTKFSEKLPLPGNRDGYDNVFNPPNFKDYIDLPLDKLDYRDTALIAVRVTGPGAALSGKRKELLPAKTNRLDASNWELARVINEKPRQPWQADAADTPLDSKAIVNLTDKLQADGTLAWDVPEGEWEIIRTGHRMTGSKVFLGQPGGEGLSIDWLNRRGMDKQFENLGQRILEASKPYIGNTLVYFCDDSFEDGFPNWTENIIEQFKKYRGYDPTPWLAVLAGYIVDSAELSDRFLHDYRKTVADLLADEHYGRFEELCHKAGLKVQNESAGPSRSGTMCMDALKNLGRSDYPMGEFWLGRRYGEPEEEDPSLGYGQTRLEGGQNKNMKMVACGAHVYGKNIVSAESFTSLGRQHWKDAPWALKYAADRAFCEGLNRVMIHTTTGTRPQDGVPGYEYGAGTHFNPNVTWWPRAGAFLEYITRCQHLLRAGRFAADVLYYCGDGAPSYIPAKHIPAGLGRGYDYDVCNEEVLLTRMTVKDGRITLPDGMSYALLMLPQDGRTTAEAARKIHELVRAGARVLGPRFTADPGLRDYPACDDEVKKLAEELWADCDGTTRTSRAVDRGKIYCGITEREALADSGISPAVEVDDPSAHLDFIHRRLEEPNSATDIFFLLNRLRQPEALKVRFRVTRGRVPYLVDAVRGGVRELKATATGECIEVALEFLPQESYFVVFAPKGMTLATARRAGKNQFPSLHTVLDLPGPWDVEFDPKWCERPKHKFPALLDWSQHEDEAVRHFSGAATYRREFDLPEDIKPATPNTPILLDLGEVRDIAGVTLNGTNLGTLWCAPWQMDISPLIRSGKNVLEIEVINTWPNRLVGDAALPKEKRRTNTNADIKPNDPLQPAGLLGPVRLIRQAW